MQQILLYLTAFAVGGVVTTYLTVNAVSAGKVDGELQPNLTYFALALVTTFAILTIREGGEGLGKLSDLPWYAYVTGIVAAVALFFTTQLIGDIGPDKFFVASVAGQLTISVALTHLGWLGVEQEAIDWQKVAGVALAIAGAVLVSFKFG